MDSFQMLSISGATSVEYAPVAMNGANGEGKERQVSKSNICFVETSKCEVNS